MSLNESDSASASQKKFSLTIHYTIKLWKMFSRQNTLVSLILITWIGISMSHQSLPKQLRHLVSFAGTWPLHLGVLRKLHTKLWFGLYEAPLWNPHSKLQVNQIKKVQRTAAHWTCRRWRNTSSVG